MNEPQAEKTEAIALIGMAGRFPGADTVDALWRNLRDGVESVRFFTDDELLAAGVDPALLHDPHYVKAYGALSNVELFDAGLFGFSPKEAAMMDPQHRLFLQCAWEALEHSGYHSERDNGRIGVFAGAGISTYLIRNLASNPKLFNTFSNFDIATTNDKDALPMRVSYKLNLKGPSINVSSTCSTSLVAVHLACASLLRGESDMALAGGAFVRVPQQEGYWYQDGMMFSPDGHSRAFDAQAAGLVPASGVGIVVLKPLTQAVADRDTIYAVIKGSAVTNDGSAKLSYATSSVDGQADTILRALDAAGVGAETISYIEAQGTGTKLGDPIELAALTKAFRTALPDSHAEAKQFCPIGSLKPNIGHTNNAAGVIGLMKVALAAHHRALPPSLHVQTPNPRLNLENSPFYVNATLSTWETQGVPRRAGVSAFGVGGTNAHVIVEEAPPMLPSSPAKPWQLLAVSAKTDTALDKAIRRLAAHCRDHPNMNLADAAYTLLQGRRALQHRAVVVCETPADAAQVLAARDPTRLFQSAAVSKKQPVVWLFSEHESRHVNMGAELYRDEPVFHDTVDNCAEILQPLLGLDIRTLLYPRDHPEQAAQQLQHTRLALLSVFVTEYALAQLWLAWGVRPHAMVGHSIGEYVAACVAGVFSLPDALTLVAEQGRLMEAQVAPGAMLAIPFTATELQAYLGEELSLAVSNKPSLSLAAGPVAAIEALHQQLTAKGVECRRLNIGHALHSKMMAPIVEPFVAAVKNVTLHAPQIPYLSNVSGAWITAAEATDPAYWGRHLHQTVRFNACLQELLQDPAQILLEVGPGRTLNTLIHQHADKTPEQLVLPSMREAKDPQAEREVLLATLGKLWATGVAIDWNAFYADQQRCRVPLPTYPFELHRYWIDAPKQVSGLGGVSQLAGSEDAEEQGEDENLSLFSSRPNLSAYTAPRNEKEQQIAKIWQHFLGLDEVGIHDNFFDLGGCSLIASHLVAKVHKSLNVDLSVQAFLNAPTIAELSKLVKLEEKDGDNAADLQTTGPPAPLVQLQVGSVDKTPLFLPHAIYGQVFLYRDLVETLPPAQPVYAFQAPGFEGEQAPLARIEDMATRYLHAMRQRQAQGPYLLGGASFGGLVAFEMAQQLLAMGQQVKLLFLLDTPGPDHALFQLEQDTAILRFIAERLFLLDTAALLAEASVAEVQAWIKTHKNVASGQLQHLIAMIRANAQAMHAYQPGFYPDRLLYFRAREVLEQSRGARPEQFWSDRADAVEIKAVSGDHFSMNLQPHIGAVAQYLKSWLET